MGNKKEKRSDGKSKECRELSTRRDALKKIAVTTLSVSVLPYTIIGCSSGGGSDPVGPTYSSGGYSSAYSSAGGGGYSSTYGSGYSSQYCSGRGSIYYYSYRCSTSYRSYGSTYYSGA